MYRLLPTTPLSPSRYYYPRLIAGTNLPTPKGWIAWLGKADCTHITFCPRLLHNWIQRHPKKMNPGCRVQDQLNTSEPTAPYIIGRELNLRKLPNQQWESNPQSSEQLRPMAIKTSASTAMATTAYIKTIMSFYTRLMILVLARTVSLCLKLILTITNVLWRLIPSCHRIKVQYLTNLNYSSSLYKLHNIQRWLFWID